RVLDHAEARRRYEAAVRFTPVHDLRVAGHYRYIGCLRRLAHGRHDAIQVGKREAFLEDERRGQVQGPRAGHREIVHGAVNGEVADVAAGEEERRDDVRVGGEGEAHAVDLDHGL